MAKQMQFTGKPKSTLDDRIKAAIAPATNISMVPEHKVAPPPPKGEEFPDVSTLISDNEERGTLEALVAEYSRLGAIEKQAADQKKPLNSRIKDLIGSYGIARATVCDMHLSYFNAPRRTISRELLLEHGIKPSIIEACTEVKDSFTLRIAAIKERE